jgi:hypothetical protein
MEELLCRRFAELAFSGADICMPRELNMLVEDYYPVYSCLQA